MPTTDRLGRDVSATLAFLVLHQDRWRPTIVVSRSLNGNGVPSIGGTFEADLNLVGVVTEPQEKGTADAQARSRP